MDQVELHSAKNEAIRLAGHFTSVKKWGLAPAGFSKH
jgi:hypothetical protein